MAEGGLKPPASFVNSTDNPSETSRSWKAWLEQYDFYMIATEKTKKDGEIQVATLLTLLGAQGQEIFRTLNIADRKDIAEVKKAFTEHFNPQVKTVFERFKFHSRVQKQGEPFESFVTALRDLITTCEFHADEKDKALVDRIVAGISSKLVREDIFNLPGNPTLQEVISVCQRKEATTQYLREMNHTTDGVNAIRSVVPPQQKVSMSESKSPNLQSDRKYRTGPLQTIKNCKYCAMEHQRGRCPAYGKVCRKCSRKNHFSTACLSSRDNSNNTANEVSEPDNVNTGDIAFAINDGREWTINAKCNGKPLRLKVDTGASCNVISQTVLASVNSQVTIVKHARSLVSFSGHALDVLGKVMLLVDVSNKYHTVEFIVVKTDTNMATLLGLPSCIELGLVDRADSITDKVAKKFTDVFNGLGRLPCKHALQLKENAQPVIQSARRVPFRLRDKLKFTLQSMESEGTIAKVRQATDWVHPIVNILKPDGSLRICLDPTQLNKNLKREHFALPTASEIFAKLSKSRVFTTLDATSGFLQIELDEASSLLTTFATPFGRYRFLRLPYGISSSPEIFCRTVSELFEDIEGVECYVDDLLIHAATETEHDKILELVLQRCRDCNLKLKESKCNFRQSELKYLGHVIGNGTIRADVRKVEAITKMPKPECKDDVSRLFRNGHISS